MSKVLIITGMHRSGTSILTRWMHEMGINIGEQLHPVSKANQDGHYEDIDFLNWHRKVLADNHLPFTVQENDKISISEALRQEAKALTAARSHLPQWGFKDPRTCLFLDFWDEMLTEHEVYFLFIIRNEQDVLSSLSNRAKESHKKILQQQPFSLKLLKKSLKINLMPGSIEKHFSKSIHYHVKCLENFAANKAPHHVSFIFYGELLERQNEVIETLTAWGFNIKPKDLGEFFVRKQIPY